MVTGYLTPLTAEGEPRCGDGSDQAHCLHGVFTGCFANSTLGLRIVPCDSCFCELRNKSSSQRQAVFYKSKETSSVKVHVVGRICMER